MRQLCSKVQWRSLRPTVHNELVLETTVVFNDYHLKWTTLGCGTRDLRLRIDSAIIQDSSTDLVYHK